MQIKMAKEREIGISEEVGRLECRNVIMRISHLLSSRSIISWGLVIFYSKEKKEKEMLKEREGNGMIRERARIDRASRTSI